MSSTLDTQSPAPPDRTDLSGEAVDGELASPQRLRALDSSELLDSPAEEIFDNATRLVSRILKAPVGLVSLVTPERQFFKSQIGLASVLDGERETPISHSLCQHVVKGKSPLVINDARLDPVAKDSPAIEDLGVIAYLGVPLFSPDGEVLGAFCAIDNQPRIWSQHDVATMQDIADMLSREIALRIKSRTIERLVELFDQASRWEASQTEKMRKEIGRLFSQLASIVGAGEMQPMENRHSLIEVRNSLMTLVQQNSNSETVEHYRS